MRSRRVGCRGSGFCSSGCEEGDADVADWGGQVLGDGLEEGTEGVFELVHVWRVLEIVDGRSCLQGGAL